VLNVTTDKQRWHDAYRDAFAAYAVSPTDAVRNRQETLLFSASLVVTSPEANGELAALTTLLAGRTDL
jgi:hypothetical protein